MFDAIIKKIVRVPRLEKFSRYLFIGPHPDDIETACAPTVKKLTDAGKEVVFLVATDGRMGAIDPALEGDALIAIRQGEARASAKLLGVDRVVFLPFVDGGMYSVEELAAELSRQIVQIRPEAVFAPDPDVISECHADHIKTGLAAKMSMNMAPYLPIMRTLEQTECWQPKALTFYYTDRPNAYVAIRQTFPCREKAMLLHKSQFTKEFVKQICLYYKLRSIRFGIRRLKGKCDGYRALAPVHMHCFPEASHWK